MGPAYTGEFVDQLFGQSKGRSVFWPDDETLIAHINYQLLSISTKACLFYQMCCISFSQARRADKLTPLSIKVRGNDAFLNQKSRAYSQVRTFNNQWDWSMINV